MAFQTLFANSTAQQVLASGDEFILGAGVTLAVDNIAIFGTGATETALFGNVIATRDSAFLVTNGSATELTIGAGANVLSAGLHAVEIQSGASIDLHNAGTLDATAATAIFLTGNGVDNNVNVDFLNTGKISGGLSGVSVNAGGENIVFANSGEILGKSSGVTLNGNTHTTYFNNSETISGTTGNGVQFLGTSDVVATNSGTISAAANEAVSLVSGRFINTGTLVTGGVSAFLANGEVTLRNAGLIVGDVRLGAGNDSFRGLHGKVQGGVFGGDGDDLILASREDDVLLGEAGGDTLYGKGDDDSLFGGAGDDWLYGNRGDDTLVGGDGKDHLRGGVGSDTFVFEDGDSGLRANADIIEDFNRRADKIDLSQMPNPLDFIGGARFSGSGSEVRIKVKRNGDTLVQIDSDGDGRADMHILVEDAGRLTEGHFIL